MTVSAVAPQPALNDPPAPPWLSTRALICGWIFSAVVLLAFVGGPPVQRTQEARVLEGARQMLSAPARGWLIPELNGAIRVRKPPVTYWLAAVAYKIGGVSEAVGRVPTALGGWLTVGLTFLIGQRLLGRAAGFFGAAALCGSYLFFRHTRLAETDAPAMLCVTLAVYCLLRAADSACRPVLWLHAFAAATALAFNCKQGPGFYPIVFLLGYCAVERRWRLALQFVTSGAILTLLIIGAGWYAYILGAVGRRQFFLELREVGTGEAHDAPLYQYIPQLLVGTMPWTGLMILAVIQAARQWRVHAGGRTVLLWAAACLLPLLLAGNRQFHYLVPSMPPLLLLAGWAIAAACRPGDLVASRPDAGSSLESQPSPPVFEYAGVEAAHAQPSRFPAAARAVLFMTGCAAVVAALGVPIASMVVRKEPPRLLDFVLAAAMVLGVVRAISVGRKRGPRLGAVTLAVLPALFLPFILGLWYPSIDLLNPRRLASQIREVAPNGPYVFAGDSLSLTLCFYLRTDLPLAKTPQRLGELIETRGVQTVLARTAGDKRSPTTAPAVADPAVRLTPVGNLRSEEHQFVIYRVERRP